MRLGKEATKTEKQWQREGLHGPAELLGTAQGDGPLLMTGVGITLKTLISLWLIFQAFLCIPEDQKPLREQNKTSTLYSQWWQELGSEDGAGGVMTAAWCTLDRCARKGGEALERPWKGERPPPQFQI